jgi:AcrR family transcriptional regulator
VGPPTLWARRRSTLAPFEDSGAKTAGSPAELAAVSDVVCLCVVDDADVEQLVTGREGALAGLRRGGVIAVHSTVHPDTCRRLESQARGAGASLLDAPVSGGGRAAEQGTLVVIMGGDPQVFAHCRPLFATSADPVVHLGPTGSGQIAKILNNLLFTAQLGRVADSGGTLDRIAAHAGGLPAKDVRLFADIATPPGCTRPRRCVRPPWPPWPRWDGDRNIAHRPSPRGSSRTYCERAPIHRREGRDMVSERREQILEAALEVLADRGFRRTSIDAVAERVGLTRQGVLHYFPSKKRLLLEILRFREELHRENLADHHAGEGLAAELAAAVAFEQSHPSLATVHNVLLAEAVTGQEPAAGYARQRSRTLQDQLAANLAERYGERLPSGLSAPTAAAAVLALVEGVHQLWLVDPDAERYPRIVRETVAVLLGTETATAKDQPPAMNG